MSVLNSEMARIESRLEQIAAINREFLRLLCSPGLDCGSGALGLDASVLHALRRLSEAQRVQLAATPLLLVEFRPLPCDGTAEDRLTYLAAEAGASQEWQERLRSFADHLLTCLWQFAHQDPAFAALAFGLDRAQSLRLASLGFESLARYSRTARVGLRARLGDHPSCWSDLVRAATKDDPAQLDTARLSLIPLALGRPQL